MEKGTRGVISSERRLGHFLHIEENGKGNQGGVISSERRVGHFLHIEEKGKENQGGDKQRNKASAEGAE